jgi:hypothetical protein
VVSLVDIKFPGARLGYGLGFSAERAGTGSSVIAGAEMLGWLCVRSQGRVLLLQALALAGGTGGTGGTGHLFPTPLVAR